MINVQNLTVLLRALRQGEPSPRATTGARPVGSILPVIALASEDGSAPALRAATEQLATSRGAQAAGMAAMREPDAQEAQDLADRPAPGRMPAPWTRSTPPATGRPAPLAPPAPNPAATIAWSPGAALLREALRADAPRLAAIRPQRPLVSTPAGDPAQLADALRTSVARSGLFYESHLAQWAASDYPAAELAHEPQAGWPSASAQAPPDEALQGKGSTWQETAAPLVRQQLDALETGRVQWTGELWPRQPASIEFVPSREAEERAAPESPAAPCPSRARLELNLLTLGRVVAVIGLQDKFVTCRITAPSIAAVERLAAAGPALADAMEAHALVLASCAIDHEHTS